LSHDPELTKSEIVFHGTAVGNIPNIIRTGLLVPGQGNEVKHATDTGYYGKGIYLSPDPAYSVAYCKGQTGKLLVCATIMGRRYKCPNLCQGASCKKDYDSHTSPDEKEYVLFCASQVLPLFVISFSGVS